jgi:hypothetical protein
MTLTKVAAQKRSPRVLDVPGAYLQSKLDAIVYMNLRGDLADLAIKHYPDKYKSNQRHDVSIRLRLLKALYGLKDAGKFATDLQRYLLLTSVNVFPAQLLVTAS